MFNQKRKNQVKDQNKKLGSFSIDVFLSITISIFIIFLFLGAFEILIKKAKTQANQRKQIIDAIRISDELIIESSLSYSFSDNQYFLANEIALETMKRLELEKFSLNYHYLGIFLKQKNQTLFSKETSNFTGEIKTCIKRLVNFQNHNQIQNQISNKNSKTSPFSLEVCIS
jgi:hypothetical protein